MRAKSEEEHTVEGLKNSSWEFYETSNVYMDESLKKILDCEDLQQLGDGKHLKLRMFERLGGKKEDSTKHVN